MLTSINLLLILVFLFIACEAQKLPYSSIEFTSDLKDFKELTTFREILKDVEIIAIGENTHGLGQVFQAKADLVKFLHQELGFNLILFESGFGDGALAWEQFDSLSNKAFTLSFTSNFYYHSKEILELMGYVKTQDRKLVVQGFDCQPQQNYLITRMVQIVTPIDSLFAKSVKLEFRNFNKLYQFENDKDTISFYKQRDEFVSFLDRYTKIIKENEQRLLKSGTTQNEIEAIRKSNQIFTDTYSKIEFGSMMGWPISANIRDKSLFETIKWFKENSPESKIIIWAQNSHIENKPKPNSSVNWMGHSLKETYGNKYYSLGAVVYSGKNLEYNRSFDFEHNDKDYLAYHLNQFNSEAFILNLRNYRQNDFINESLLGMESGGNTVRFIAKERFDGILFIKYSGIPQIITDK
jgi:erythromycin esterase